MPRQIKITLLALIYGFIFISVPKLVYSLSSIPEGFKFYVAVGAVIVVTSIVDYLVKEYAHRF